MKKAHPFTILDSLVQAGVITFGYLDTHEQLITSKSACALVRTYEVQVRATGKIITVRHVQNALIFKSTPVKFLGSPKSAKQSHRKALETLLSRVQSVLAGEVA